MHVEGVQQEIQLKIGYKELRSLCWGNVRGRKRKGERERDKGKKKVGEGCRYARRA